MSAYLLVGVSGHLLVGVLVCQRFLGRVPDMEQNVVVEFLFAYFSRKSVVTVRLPDT